MPIRPTDGYASVVFDCDSTLVSVEGIDQLARAGHADAVAALTEAAMQGEVALEEVYGRRLEIIRPTRAQVDEVGRRYVAALLPDAREVVAALRWLGKEVRIVSGGLRPPVEHVARELGLSAADVAAVAIDFGADGAYRGFESTSPLTRNGGKPGLIQAWNLPRPSMLVGDGHTDMEAKPVVDAFVAYMGVVWRPAVAAAGDVLLRDPSLAPVLALAAGDADRERLNASPWAAVLARGDTLLAAALADPSREQR
jgi:phosphoserine phosphatase